MENKLNQPTIDRIEQFLQEMIEKLESNHREPVGRGRPRILPAMCLWAGVVICILRGWNSQLKIWRLLSQKGLWDYPRFAISDEAVYKRLEEAGPEPLKQLYEQISTVLLERLQQYAQKIAPFASEVVAIDATTLDQVLRHLPILRNVPNGGDALMPGKLAGVFDLRVQQWRYVEHVPEPHQNEKVGAQNLLQHIQQGALIIMDLGFFSFPWFDQLTSEGYYWLSRMRQKTSYEIIHTFYKKGSTFDGLVFLGNYRADRARYAVRMVTFQVGEINHQYITNVLHPSLLGLKDIAVLYARRWDIEMAFKLIKRELGLHLFWSAKTNVILQQVWAVLLISQILYALQLEIAAKAEVDPFDVSMPLLVEYLPAWNDIDFVEHVVELGRSGGFIRPSRRIRPKTPPIDMKEYSPSPPDLCLAREPRYARRRVVWD